MIHYSARPHWDFGVRMTACAVTGGIALKG